MNKRVLILSGPTHEYIDPVRFIGNASSGKMGQALAEEARNRGDQVDFITGPVSPENLPHLASSQIHPITSAKEMLQTAQSLFQQADIILFVAAVADYAPLQKLEEKMAKSDSNLTLHLRPTPDIAKTLCTQKRSEQITIGFALQTHDGETQARRKLITKNLNGIVLNTPASLGANHGTFHFIHDPEGPFAHWGALKKEDCARQIFNAIDLL